MAKEIVIAVNGVTRLPIDIARDFVREQSVGEWSDEIIEKDAAKIAEIMKAYAQFYNPYNMNKTASIEYEG